MIKEGLRLHSGRSCWHPYNSLKCMSLPPATSDNPPQSHYYKLKYASAAVIVVTGVVVGAEVTVALNVASDVA